MNDPRVAIELLQWILIGAGLSIFAFVIVAGVLLFRDRSSSLGPLTWKEEQRRKGYRV